MKKTIAALVIFAVLVALGVSPVAAGGHEVPAGPPTVSGYDYAQTHIVPLAKAGIIGQVHKPGTHQGLANFPPG